MLYISPIVTGVVSVHAKVMYCYQSGYRSRGCVMISLAIDFYSCNWELSFVACAQWSLQLCWCSIKISCLSQE